MKRLLIVLVVVAAIVAGFGYYRGWFSFSTSNENDKTNFNISVDKDKIQQDKESAKERIHGLQDKAQQKLGDSSKEKSGATP
jgi:uncharacterized protein YxeA